MKKSVLVTRVLIGLSLLVVVLIGLSMYGLKQFKQIVKYKPQIINFLEQTTGRDIQIAGDLNLKFFPKVGLSLTEVIIGNIDWGSSPYLLKIKSMDAKVALLPLIFSKELEIHFALDSAKIFLETNQQGQGNWQLTPPKKSQAATKSPKTKIGEFSIEDASISVENADITYLDGRTGSTKKLAVRSIKMLASGLDNPLRLNAEIVYNEIPVKLTGTLGNLMMLEGDYPIKLTISSNDIRLTTDGFLNIKNDPPIFKFNIAVDTESLANIGSLVAQDLPDIGPLSITATFAGDLQTYKLMPFSIKLAKSDVSGDLSFFLAKHSPKIDANLLSNTLDISKLAAAKKPNRTAAKKVASGRDKLFSDEPLALIFPPLSVDLNWQIKALLHPIVPMENIELSLALQDDTLTIDMRQGNILKGKAQSHLKLVAGNPMTVALDTQIENVKPLLSPFIKADKNMSGLETDLSLKIDGVGNSVAQIMGSLDGSLLLEMGQGQISSQLDDWLNLGIKIDLLSAINFFSKDEKYASVECAVLKVDFDQGIANIDNGFAIQTSRINTLGGGKIDFKTQTLDIGLTPTGRKGVGVDAGSLLGLARVQGALAQPEVNIDVGEALKTGGSIATAVATGGWSLLAKQLLDLGDSDIAPCQIALNKPEVKQPPPADTKNTAKKVVEDELKDALKNIFR